MPNIDPRDLPIRKGKNAQAKSPVPGWPCATHSCVDIVQDGGLFLIRSTRRVDATPVPFDADEMVKFLNEVKAGHWDAMLAAAQAQLQQTALS